MGSTWQNGLSLYNIIQHYDTFMTLIAIIAINTLLWLFPEGEVAFSGQENAGMGHTPRVSCWRRIPAAWSPRSVVQDHRQEQLPFISDLTAMLLI